MKELTKGNPFKIIILFALPILLGNIFQRVYNMTDSKIVSLYISPNALAAIGATTPISNLLIGFVNSLTQGFAILVARSFGANSEKLLKRFIAGTVIVTGMITVILTVVGVFCVKPILLALDTPEEILGDSVLYLRIIIAGMVFVSLFNMVSNILRAVGDSKRPLVCLIISVVLNIGFDILFIKTFQMGIAGAAYATLLAQAISAFSSLWILLTKYKGILPGRKEWRLDGKGYYDLITTGLSMGFMGCLVSIGSVILQRSINKLGTTVITAQTTGRKIFDILMVVIFSIGFSMTTYVSQNMGAGKKERVRQGVRAAILIDTAFTMMIILLAFVFGKPIVRWLASTDDAEIIDKALVYLLVGVLFFFVLGPLFILRCSLQGMGRKIVPIVSSSLEMVMKILFAFIFVPIFGYMGVVLTEPVSWIIMIIPLIIVYAKERKMLVDEIEA